MQNSFKWCFRNVQLLWTTVNWCWWRFTHSFCHSSNILGCTHGFWLFTLCFINEDATFFHFFHKITNIRSWRCFSSSKVRTQFSHTFCNITMIFAIFPNVVQAYTRIAFYISGLENKINYFFKIFPIKIYTLLHAFEPIAEALLSLWLIDFFERLTNCVGSNANKFFSQSNVHAILNVISISR